MTVPKAAAMLRCEMACNAVVKMCLQTLERVLDFMGVSAHLTQSNVFVQ